MRPSPVVNGPAAAVAADEADAERRVVGSRGGVSFHEAVDRPAAGGAGGLASGYGTLPVEPLQLAGLCRLVERAAMVRFRHPDSSLR